MEIQTRPKKPPDAGYLKLKRVGPGPVLMNTYGDDNGLHEEEFVYTERDTMGDMGVRTVPYGRT